MSAYPISPSVKGPSGSDRGIALRNFKADFGDPLASLRMIKFLEAK